jgi:ABC-type multidrug transport system permease subunit
MTTTPDNSDEQPIESLWVIVPFLLAASTMFWFLYYVI